MPGNPRGPGVKQMKDNKRLELAVLAIMYIPELRGVENKGQVADDVRNIILNYNESIGIKKVR